MNKLVIAHKKLKKKKWHIQEFVKVVREGSNTLQL
jgi:hypothetical protein